MNYNGVTLLVTTLLWRAAVVFCGLSDEELLDTKLSDYFDVRVRPRIAPGKPANISVFASLSHIHSLDLNKAELDLTVWIELTWMDPRLRWDVVQTENQVKQLVLPENNVWTPDITIGNAIGPISPILRNQVVLQSTGTVAWLQAYRTVIGCFTNITADEQACVLMIGSWRYDSSDVDLYSVSENFTATEDFYSHEWGLLDSYVDRTNLTRTGAPYPFLAVTMNLLHLIVEETEPTAEPLCITEHKPNPSAASPVTSVLILNVLSLCLVKLCVL